jgi:hypothetical protein
VAPDYFYHHAVCQWLAVWLAGREVAAPFSVVIASAGLTVLLDWAENIGFVALVTISPGEAQWLAVFTLGLHAGKLIFMMVFNVLICVLLAAVIFLVIRQETK